MSSAYVTRVVAPSILAAAFILAGDIGSNFPFGQAAQAQEDDSGKILKQMSDYLASQKDFSVSFDSDVEVVTPEVQKIQFTNSGKLQLSRPDKLRASRSGGYSDVELVFDGKTASLAGKSIKAFAQFDSAGSIDQLFDLLRHKYLVTLPGADLVLSDVYAALTSDVIQGRHIGRGVVEGVECEHLAFRGEDTDWQIWIETGDRPLPRKYVITSKGVAAAPQYTLVLKDWKTGSPPSADAFVFTPAPDAKKVEVKELSNLDEIPTAEGRKQ